jgi:Contractile injection system tube protein/LysM domain
MALAKAKITNLQTGQSFNVLFNPEEYTLNKDNNFASQSVPGLSSPLLQFVSGNLRTLEMELFFDTFEPTPGPNPKPGHRDVREETQKVVDLLKIDPDLHAPPVLQVSWASLQFTCVLARVSQKFIMFLDDGRPVRARLTVTFNEFINEEREAKEINRQTADFSKAVTVAQGDRLIDIAGRMYGDEQKWRPIAMANGLVDPREIQTGQTLHIPSLPFTDQQSGEVFK